MTAASFTEAVAAKAFDLFITYRGRRLWLDWHVAHEFAFFCSLTCKRKQRVRGAFVAGRWYWFVQVVPAPLSDDGAGAPPAMNGAGRRVATSTLAPSSPVRPAREAVLAA